MQEQSIVSKVFSSSAICCRHSVIPVTRVDLVNDRLWHHPHFLLLDMGLKTDAYQISVRVAHSCTTILSGCFRDSILGPFTAGHGLLSRRERPFHRCKVGLLAAPFTLGNMSGRIVSVVSWRCATAVSSRVIWQ